MDDNTKVDMLPYPLPTVTTVRTTLMETPEYKEPRSKIAAGLADLGRLLVRDGYKTQGHLYLKVAISYDPSNEAAQEGYTPLAPVADAPVQKAFAEAVALDEADHPEREIKTAVVWFRSELLSKGYYIVGKGLVLRSFPLSHEGKRDAIRYSKELAQCGYDRQNALEDALEIDDIFDIELYELDDSLSLIHEAEARDLSSKHWPSVIVQ